jgi:hypothetical protein
MTSLIASDRTRCLLLVVLVTLAARIRRRSCVSMTDEANEAATNCATALARARDRILSTSKRAALLSDPHTCRDKNLVSRLSGIDGVRTAPSHTGYIASNASSVRVSLHCNGISSICRPNEPLDQDPKWTYEALKLHNLPST